MSLSPETYAAIAAAAGAIAVTAKKLLNRRQKPKPEYITRAEFHHGLDAVRDRIGGSYLAVAEKIDTNHRDLLTALDRQGANFERRIDQLEINMARMDERTKTL